MPSRSGTPVSRPDIDHLQPATKEDRVLCTHDQDFLRLAAEGARHSGIAFLPQNQVSIGGWVRALRSLHARFEASQARNQIFFLSF